MEWAALMSDTRIGNGRQSVRRGTLKPARSEFQRDWDRIVFSNAFRRLHDKTQVFPLPGKSDVVHSRLAHSLEVACVGRMLGLLVGRGILAKMPDAPFDAHDIGAVVAAAALAHDIGNPPLGHAGERAIRKFFASGNALLGHIDERMMTDLKFFDGNPQGFRVLTRLQQEDEGGMQLTAATLATFSKYPWPVSDARAGTKVKFGYFGSERPLFDEVAACTGLTAMQCGWARHPLAFLVEAADDICYSILDIEDGVRLNLVTRDDALELFSGAAGNDWQSGATSIAQFRANAIENLVLQASERFLENEEAILRGEYGSSLTHGLAGIETMRKFASSHCYRAPDVLRLEEVGDKAICGLIERFVDAILEPNAEKHASVARFLDQRGVRMASAGIDQNAIRLVDYVSGMTDRFVCETYTELTGIDLGEAA